MGCYICNEKLVLNQGLWRFITNSNLVVTLKKKNVSISLHSFFRPNCASFLIAIQNVPQRGSADLKLPGSAALIEIFPLQYLHNN